MPAGQGVRKTGRNDPLAPGERVDGVPVPISTTNGVVAETGERKLKLWFALLCARLPVKYSLLLALSSIAELTNSL